MSSKRWWRSIPIGVTAIVAVTFGAGLGGSAAMGAEVDGVDANGEPTGDVMVGQDLVMEVVDPLLALVNPTEGGERVTADGAEYGYAGVIVDPVAREVDVYWVGSVEAKAQRILDRAPSEVTLNVRDAKYTVFEMQDAVDRLPGMTVDDTSGDLTIVASGPEADGSGVWVEYSGDGRRNSRPSRRTEWLSPQQRVERSTLISLRLTSVRNSLPRRDGTATHRTRAGAGTTCPMVGSARRAFL